MKRLDRVKERISSLSSYLSSDLGLYLEDVRDGRRFLEAAKAAVARKPVLVMQGGRTEAGARATASHTASLAVRDAVFEGALRQAGVIRVQAIDEFIRTLRGFLKMPLPGGGRLALVTYSGAQAIMSIDAAVEEGLEMARFEEETKKKIARVIATPSKAGNPIDPSPICWPTASKRPPSSFSPPFWRTAGWTGSF